MDKRRYSREVINVSSNFFVEGASLGRREFEGTVADISECGVGIRIEDEKSVGIVSKIPDGSAISFQFVDEYELFGVVKTSVVYGKVSVVRKNVENGVTFLGCVIEKLDHDLEQYIHDKKLCGFRNRRFAVLGY